VRPPGVGGRRYQARRGDRVPLTPARAAHGAFDGAVTAESGKGRTKAALNSDITFETDSATLMPRATEVLDGIVSAWGGTPPASMTVVGHTDSVADETNGDGSVNEAGRAANRRVELTWDQ